MEDFCQVPDFDWDKYLCGDKDRCLLEAFKIRVRTLDGIFIGKGTDSADADLFFLFPYDDQEQFEGQFAFMIAYMEALANAGLSGRAASCLGIAYYQGFIVEEDENLADEMMREILASSSMRFFLL